MPGTLLSARHRSLQCKADQALVLKCLQQSVFAADAFSKANDCGAAG